MASTFQSPFDDLGTGPVTVNGVMQCQTCYVDAHTGTYDRRRRVLTYTCPDGHENILENWNIE